MKKFLIMGLAILGSAGFAQDKFQAINLEYMDTNVRPQDDFYNFVNGNWMKNTEIPSDKARWGSFDELRENTDNVSLGILKGLLGKQYKKGSDEQKIGDFNILDETGFVKVIGADLEFYNKTADRYEGGKTRHSEGYLLQDDYMMLMGYASSDEGKTIIQKEDKNIFIIANPSNIENYNKGIPLLNSFLITLFITTLLLLFILLN